MTTSVEDLPSASTTVKPIGGINNVQKSVESYSAATDLNGRFVHSIITMKKSQYHLMIVKYLLMLSVELI